MAALATAIGFVARPREDRHHRTPTPFLGGLALFLALLAGLAAAGLLTSALGDRLAALVTAPPAMLLLTITAASFLIGLVDDWKNLSPPAKMAGQVVVAALFLTVAGPGPFRSAVPDGVLGLLWILGVMNACNFLDNMDGALAGAALPAAMALAAMTGEPACAVFALVLAGGVAGFLAWNRPPARIFLGDAGSLLIGGALAATGWMIASRAGPLALWLAVPLAMAWPIFDMTFVTVTRLTRGQSPWIGGRDHTTHRLAGLLGGPGRAFLVVVAVSVIAALAAVGLARGRPLVAALGLGAGVSLLTLLGLRLGRVPVR